jgi:pantoate--beta-alanine ligase
LTQLERVRTANAVREQVSAWRSAGDRIGFVPTMGNLHAGHLSLVDQASVKVDRVVVSIFVNPTQFGPQEDIQSYPRTPVEDEALLARQGRTDLLFVPSESEIYPHGTADIVTVQLPSLAADLCGKSRPGHFNGVASVMLRLLNISRPDLLVMGQKDYQQLILLKRMIEELHMAIELLPGVTVREPDGLAMSSRNQYLTAEQRAAAPQLYAALCELAAELRDGGTAFETQRARALNRLERSGFEPDYLELRDSGNLSVAAPCGYAHERVLMLAARLGRARLIDNLLV